MSKPQDALYSPTELLIALRIREEIAAQRVREAEQRLFEQLARLSA